MSNPCASRWGINSFWHNFWYSDSRYAQYVQQDNVIVELIQLYITYGTIQEFRLGPKWFWYKTSSQPTYLSVYRYTRWTDVPATEHIEGWRGCVRLASPETFQTRVSVLRFSGWILINIYWFLPDKQGNKRARRSRLMQQTLPVINARSSKAPLVKLNFLRQLISNRAHPLPTNYAF